MFKSKNNKEKELINRELELYKKEKQLDIKAEILNDNTAIVENRKSCTEDLMKDEHQFHKLKQDRGIEIQRLKDSVEITELTIDNNALEKKHEFEKQHLANVTEATTELNSIKNEAKVALETKKSVDAQIDERKKTLSYVQENIDSILKQKDGEIAGWKNVAEMYQRQLEYMQNVLAVAVGKIPTVNLNDFKINVEMPATVAKNEKGANNAPPKN